MACLGMNNGLVVSGSVGAAAAEEHRCETIARQMRSRFSFACASSSKSQCMSSANDGARLARMASTDDPVA